MIYLVAEKSNGVVHTARYNLGSLGDAHPHVVVVEDSPTDPISGLQQGHLRWKNNL